MSKQAIVKEMHGCQVLVGLYEACDDTKCAVCGLCAKDSEALLELTIDEEDFLSVGDVVEIEITVPASGYMSLLLFGVPLITMFVFSFLGVYVAQSHVSLGMVIGGAVGFGIGLGLLALLDRFVLCLRPSARLLQVVS